MADTQKIYSYQNTIPPELQYDAKLLMAKTRALTEAPYQPYPEQRIGDLSPMQLQALQNIANYQVPAQLGVASTATTKAVEDLLKSKYKGLVDYNKIGLNNLDSGFENISEIDDALNDGSYRTPFKNLDYKQTTPELIKQSRQYRNRSKKGLKKAVKDIKGINYDNMSDYLKDVGNKLSTESEFKEGGDTSKRSNTISLSNKAISDLLQSYYDADSNDLDDVGKNNRDKGLSYLNTILPQLMNPKHQGVDRFATLRGKKLGNVGTVAELAGIKRLNSAKHTPLSILESTGSDLLNTSKNDLSSLINNSNAANYTGTQDALKNRSKYLFGNYGETARLAREIANPKEAYSSENINKYMSPYMQDVIEQETRAAINEHKKASRDFNLRNAGTGSLGSARNIIAQTELNNNLQAKLNEIQSRGREKAFQDAKQQLNNERQFGLAEKQAAATITGNIGQQSSELLKALEQSKQFGHSSSLQGKDLASRIAQAKAQLGSQLATEAERGRQFGSNLSLQAKQAAAGIGAQLQQAGLSYQDLGERIRQFRTNNKNQNLQSAAGLAQNLNQLGLSYSDLAERGKQFEASHKQQGKSTAGQQANALLNTALGYRQLAANTNQADVQNKLQKAQMLTQMAQQEGSQGLSYAQLANQANQAVGDIMSREAQYGSNKDMTRLQQKADLAKYISGLGQQQIGLGEQSKQFGKTSDLQSRQNAIVGSGQLANLGLNQQQLNQDIDLMKYQAGATEQGQYQKLLDQAYQDFLNQKNLDMNKLAFWGSMIRGVPIGGTAIQYAPPVSRTAELAGLGTLGLGLYRAYNQAQNPVQTKAKGGLLGTYKRGGNVKHFAGGGLGTGQATPASVAKVINDKDPEVNKFETMDTNQLSSIMSSLPEGSDLRGKIEAILNLRERIQSSNAAKAQMEKQNNQGFSAVPTPPQMSEGGEVDDDDYDYDDEDDEDDDYKSRFKKPKKYSFPKGDFKLEEFLHQFPKRRKNEFEKFSEFSTDGLPKGLGSGISKKHKLAKGGRVNEELDEEELEKYIEDNPYLQRSIGLVDYIKSLPKNLVDKGMKFVEAPSNVIKDTVNNDEDNVLSMLIKKYINESPEDQAKRFREASKARDEFGKGMASSNSKNTEQKQVKEKPIKNKEPNNEFTAKPYVETQQTHPEINPDTVVERQHGGEHEKYVSMLKDKQSNYGSEIERQQANRLIQAGLGMLKHSRGYGSSLSKIAKGAAPALSGYLEDVETIKNKPIIIQEELAKLERQRHLDDLNTMNMFSRIGSREDKENKEFDEAKIRQEILKDPTVSYRIDSLLRQGKEQEAKKLLDEKVNEKVNRNRILMGYDNNNSNSIKAPSGATITPLGKQ